MNTLAGVNDPRENKQWEMSPLLPVDESRSYKEYDDWSQVTSDEIKANSKVLCFSVDRPEASSKWPPQAHLDRGFAKPAMWHHYADRHHGVCLMFDRARLHDALAAQLTGNFLNCGRVKYSDDGILPKAGASPFSPDFLRVTSHEHLRGLIQRHGAKWQDALFFTKLRDWRNEDEFRWVLSDTHPSPRYVSFGDALVAIVVGEASAFPQRWFTPFCVKYSAELATLRWRNGFPVLNDWTQPHISEVGKPSGNDWQARVLQRVPERLFSQAVRFVRELDRWYWGN